MAVEINVTLNERLAEKLRAAAEREQLSLDAYVEKVLTEHLPAHSTEESDEGEPPPGTSAALAASARRANIRTGRNDVSEHSREILEEDWSKHLMRRTDEQDDPSNG